MNSPIVCSARSAWILGLSLALGGAASAAIIGHAIQGMGAGRQTITVKGLAEKPVRADKAEWHLSLQLTAPTFADAVRQLEAEKPLLLAYLQQQGLSGPALSVGDPNIEPHMEEETVGERTRSVQRGYNGHLDVVVQSTALDKIGQAHRGILALQAAGRPIVNNKPLYLVSDLENVKMSLIGAATDNAQKRAEEFAKHGAVHVGAMRNAAQGAFYILPPGSTQQDSDYGGTYDKTTVDKIARVVVTIDYSVEK